MDLAQNPNKSSVLHKTTRRSQNAARRRRWSRGQRRFMVDERGKGRLNFYRTKGAKAVKSRSDAWKLASYEVAGNASAMSVPS
jgi:hypothetical protein